MQSRCRKEHADHHVYFDRGITVCARWLGPGGYENFLTDMGRRPSAKHSLDRKNGENGYAPENCRWATAEEQQNNRRDNIWLTHEGVTLSASQWDRKTGIHKRTLYNRLKAGWPVARALSP